MSNEQDGSVVPNVGNSYGNAAIKPKDIEQLIAADKTGQFADITKFASNTKEFRQAVANMLLNEPLRVATARSQYYIDQWNEARKTDPTVAKIEDMPEVLAFLMDRLRMPLREVGRRERACLGTLPKSSSIPKTLKS